MLFLLSLPFLTLAATWCGKNYQSTDPIVPPGGQFQVPATSTKPLLALRCAPAFKPYVVSEGNHAEILIDIPIVYQQIVGALPFTQDITWLQVVISIDGVEVGKAERVPVNVSKFAIPIDLGGLTPRKEYYTVSCSAPGFGAKTKLAYLPDNTNGTVTKFDARTGGLLAKPIHSPQSGYEPVFPFGFYTSFDDYLAINVSQVDLLKEQGFTIIHPTPTFSNITALQEVIDRMDKVGIYLMYDMRWTYMNATSVAEQVEMIKSHPSLLLWYTADEPDGTSDPLDATAKSRELITNLDGGGHHPVSLVLNCDDCHFEEYTAGGEIILQDAYVIGINATWSVVWNTPCTEDYGDCGCDNCIGKFEDISRRIDEYRERLWILGRELESVVWTVPQGFGGSSYWSRMPTGKEWVVMALLGINHGAMGVVSWNDPTSPEIKSASSLLAKSLPSLVPFLFSHKATVHRLVYDRVDVAAWAVPGQGVLVIATNMNYVSKTLKWAQIGLASLDISSSTERGQIIQQVFSLGGAVRQDRGFVLLEAVGSVAFVIPQGRSARDEL